MIGLDITLKNEYGNYLYKIFNDIELEKYMWEIVTDDILFVENDENKQGLFENDIIKGESFRKSISRHSYYLIFADIKAYPIGSKFVEIETYNDYLKSDCEMVLLCADSTFIQFYCKNINILNKVYNNCIEFGIQPITKITEENNPRTRMIVW